jgi:MFS family permease
MSIVIEPVKHDLGLTDTQISLLIGFSFAALYALAGIPLGWMADRFNRSRIIAMGIAAWTFMTALCGWCGSFASLFLARMGVGVGEAALYPAALSLIADYFPPARRHLAVTTFVMGGVAGTAIAFIVGAIALEFGRTLASAGSTLLGMHADWQWAFILVAAPGAFIALLMTTIREPVRQGVLRAQADGKTLDNPLALSEVTRFVRRHWRTYACLFGGASLMIFAAVGYMLWGVSMFVRVHGWTQSHTAAVFGPGVLLLGLGGNLLAATLSRALTARGYTDGIMRAGLIMASIAVVPVVVGTLLPNPYLVIAVAFPGLGCLVGVSTLVVIAIQMIVPNQMRGQFSAAFSFCVNFIGLGLGPTFIALLTDYVYRDENRLHHSIATSAAIIVPLGIILFAVGLKHFRRSALEARDWATS